MTELTKAEYHRPELTLHHGDPKILMVCGPNECVTCGDSYWLEQAGEEPICLSCCLTKSGKDYLVMFGWKIMRSSNQMIAAHT